MKAYFRFGSGRRVFALAMLACLLAFLFGIAYPTEAAPKQVKPFNPSEAKKVVPPSVRMDFSGERNVIREMPRARYEFGKKTEADVDRFILMVMLFEKPTGFQGEAEMEAARRVLNISESFVERIIIDMWLFDLLPAPKSNLPEA
jgi:hypothetical protein